MTVGTKPGYLWGGQRDLIVRNSRFYATDWRQEMRGAATVQKSVLFLYPSRESAENSREEGASGFIVGIGSKVAGARDYHYAVTNRHVVEKGISVIRLNTKGGGVDILDLKPTDWETSPSDDLAACEIPLDFEKHDAQCVTVASFLTPQDIAQFDMGPGMECYVVGRFVAHSGNHRNQPAARFGAVSMLESEPIKQDNGHLQESFLVEMHSISGYSGSPVYIYLSPHTPGTQITYGWEYKSWFLGVDWGHLAKWEPVVDRQNKKHPDGWRVRLNSGMMGVVPCWRLLDFLNSEVFMENRQKNEKQALAEQEHSGALDVAEGEPESNFTRQDFEAALKKVSRKLPPSKSDEGK